MSGTQQARRAGQPAEGRVIARESDAFAGFHYSEETLQSRPVAQRLLPFGWSRSRGKYGYAITVSGVMTLLGR